MATEAPRDTAPFYRPELDGLRFFAFFAVFVSHAFPATLARLGGDGLGAIKSIYEGAVRSGAHGVDLFFVLSSFLITELLLREQEQHGRLRPGAFWARRALRIWPLFLAMLLLSVPLDPLVDRAGMGLRYFIAYIAFAGNWSCVAWGYPASVAAPLWSVSIEEQFYLAWPFLVAWAGARRLVPLAVGGVIMAFIARIAVVAQGATHPAAWCSTLCRLDTIAAGVLLAVWLRTRTQPLTVTTRIALLLFGIVLWVATEVFFPLDRITWLGTVGGYGLFVVSSVAIIVGVYGTPMGLFKLFASRALVWLGKISYGLYVFHMPAVAIVWKLTSGVAPSMQLVVLASRIPLSLGLTIALSAISYHFYERRFLVLKKRFEVVRSRPA